MTRFDRDFAEELLRLFRWRRDVRRFRRDPLPAGTLERLVAIASLAPSVGLSEPWRFVVVADPGRRHAVRDEFVACNAEAAAAMDPSARDAYAALKLEGLDEAPVHLALFVERDPVQGRGLGRRTMPDTTAFSAVMALHTIWLAARAESIGLGWVSILRPDRVSAILDVPPAWDSAAYCCVGYPQEESVRPELERLGWEQRGRIGVLYR